MSTDPARWDDYVLGALLLFISVPRLVLSLVEERPLGVEGTVSIILSVLGILLVFRRRT